MVALPGKRKNPGESIRIMRSRASNVLAE